MHVFMGCIGRNEIHRNLRVIVSGGNLLLKCFQIFSLFFNEHILIFWGFPRGW